MPEKQTICPLMSGPSPITTAPAVAYCRKQECQLWITVYTTENHRTEDCAHALAPQMVDGLLRV